VEGERVAEGSAVAVKRRNGRGAKGPCCWQRLPAFALMYRLLRRSCTPMGLAAKIITFFDKRAARKKKAKAFIISLPRFSLPERRSLWQV
jgi:hypothetical protein